MKRLLRPIKATTQNPTDNFLFSVDDVIELLCKIEELNNKRIDSEVSSDGNLDFIIGDKVYTVVFN